MEDPSKTSGPSKINRHILPLTADLLAASKNLLNSAGSLRDRLQEDHSFIVKLEFGSPEAMSKADEFLTQLAIRTSASFESLSRNFLLYKKLFLDPLLALLQLHLQFRWHEYPDKFLTSGSTLVPIKEYASITGLHRQLSEENLESQAIPPSIHQIPGEYARRGGLNLRSGLTERTNAVGEHGFARSEG